MKILIVSNYFESHRGGIEIVAGQLGRALRAARDCRITWVASDATAAPEEFPGRCVPLASSNVTERRLGFPWPIPSPGAFRVLRRLVDESDVVLLHDTLYLANAAAYHFCRRLRKPVIAIQHVGLVPYRNTAVRTLMALGNRFVARPILSGADRTVFISGLTRRYFERLCTFRAPPETIYNGLGGVFAGAAADDAANRTDPAAGGTSGRRPTVAFVGRFVEKKGIEVMRRLAGALPAVDWLLAGWGDVRPEDWSCGNVTVRRNLDPEQVLQVYRDADLMVLPSTGEGLPLVVQEALACGTPILAGEDMLTADPWLQGRVSVAPVYPGEPGKTAAVWAPRIEELTALPAAAAVDSVAVRHRYSWENAAQAYWRIIDEAASRKARRDGAATRSSGIARPDRVTGGRWWV